MRLLRPTWFEIDLDAAAANLRTVRRLVGPDRKVFAVLKADAYGFGALEMARVFADHGADALAVADLSEGVRLRWHGFTLPIHLQPGRMLVRGRGVPLLATPSLEHTRLDLTAVPEARVGDEVVAIGRQGATEITAAHHGREPLHLAPAVGARVARGYLSGGEVASVVTRGD